MPKIKSLKKLLHSATALVSILLVLSSPIFSDVLSTHLESPRDFIIQSLYTTTADGSYERVFKWGTDFYIVGVIRNLHEKSINLSRIVFEIVDENNNSVYIQNIKTLSIQPYGYKTLKFKWNCPLELASWSEAGFRFVGKKFFAKLKVENVSKSFQDIVESLNEIVQLLNFIANSSEEQRRGIEDINKAISQLDRLLQETSAISEELAASSEELNSMVKNLYHGVDDLSMHISGTTKEVEKQREMLQAKAEKQYLKPEKKKQLPPVEEKPSEKEIKPDQIIETEENEFKEFK